MISTQAFPRDERHLQSLAELPPEDVVVLCAASRGFALAVADYIALSRAARDPAGAGFAHA